MIYHLSTKIKPQIANKLGFICEFIKSGKLDSTLRVDAALEYLLSNVNETKVDIIAFEKACGVGVVVTPEQVEQAVEKHMVKYKDELIEKRYRFNAGIVMQAVRADLPWADGKAIKNEVDVQVNIFHIEIECCSCCLLNVLIYVERIFMRLVKFNS